ncbi:bifunctional protein-serine/threonine kinase/phosphatase [Shewanella aestuarii]|uniref:Bifunctional protein-serine/threonine kinase/phosphatase n=1 Tax=Shewanella aestuarii TaxID=1028752 RepID=A0A6G9QMI5_9GAMM|nr:bifunctional protein-serine/threonine kinase/phosphatase [Shewanella aestuarii]QIR15608.1 bifunctional protein-serine/threonine kinase/phosphatase [Shewanella aestuarii]
MSQALVVSIGGATDKGVKTVNQDAIGWLHPEEPQLSTKGVALAIADGISSSKVSQIASEAAVSSFLADYYCTSESWSVKRSGRAVIKSINYWLCAQTRNSPYRFNKDKGYVCTFSGLVFKSNTAHIFHCGDSRVYRLHGNALEQLTTDHRRVVSSEVSYLSRALGIDQLCDIDYHSYGIEQDDVFLLSTDGLHEFVSGKDIYNAIQNSTHLEQAAKCIIKQAIDNGSDDNLSVQLARIEQLPSYQLNEIHQLTQLPLPTNIGPRMQLDGFEILRQIYISSRSHVYLARDLETQKTVVIKTPSTEMRSDPQYLERFMLEEWIAKRMNNPHVAKAIPLTRKRSYLYLVVEYIEGVSLHQWMADNPNPNLEQVRMIVEQIAKGLQAFHRQDMLHQDLRPNNIMIDHTNTVKIIDFGSVFIAGVTDIKNEESVRGTIRYSAPEHFLGQQGTVQSDLYSLAVITYQMLSTKFPYSAAIAQASTPVKQRRLVYNSILLSSPHVPPWIDETLKKALSIHPQKRYATLSEFIADLCKPNQAYIQKTKPPLMQRNPVQFWQGVSIILLIIVVIQAMN